MGRITRATGIAGTVLCVGLLLASSAQAAEPTAEDRARADDEMVVTAKAIGELRIKIELAENAVYARFNDINSNDDFDIHCYEDAPQGSHIRKRACKSNAWRKLDVAIGQATLRGMQGPPATDTAGGTGEYGAIPQKYRATQLHTEGLVQKELARLAHEDPELKAAMMRVGQARLGLEAVTGSRSSWTLYRDVPAGEDGLPFGARRVVEVRIGEAALNHALTSHTFTIDGVRGRIRELRLTCDHNDSKLIYREGVDWTVPAEWGACALRVDAKRDTTFVLYEFE